MQKSSRKNLTQKRKQEIESFTHWINEEFNPTKGPVQLDEILSKNNITIKEGKFKEKFDGNLIYYNNQFTIILNNNRAHFKSAERRRFTLAHELGHFFIPCHNLYIRNHRNQTNSHYINTSEPKLVEKEADFFAACLLMPSDWIAEDFNASPFSLKHIAEIATRYQVSLSAALNRYTLLGDQPIMIINSRQGKIIESKFANCSQNFPHHKLQLQNDQSLPPNSLAATLTKNNHTNGFQTKQLLVTDWFIPTDPTHSQNPIIESCYTHDQQITTIIHLPHYL